MDVETCIAAAKLAEKLEKLDKIRNRLEGALESFTECRLSVYGTGVHYVEIMIDERGASATRVAEIIDDVLRERRKRVVAELYKLTGLSIGEQNEEMTP